MKDLEFGKVFNLSLGLLALAFCFAPKLISLFIILQAVLVVVGFIKKQISFELYHQHVFLALFYVAYLIGMIFTNHRDIAFGYAENKLSFLVFPLLFSFKPKFKLYLDMPILGLVVGLSIASIIGLFGAIYSQIPNLSTFQRFTSSNFSSIHHPSYFAMFLLISIFAVVHQYKQKSTLFNLKWIIPYIIFAGIAFVLCLSLAGMLFLFLFLVYLLLRWLYMVINKKIFFLALISIPFFFLLLFSNFPAFKIEFLQTKKSVFEYLESPSKFVREKTRFATGNESRLIMWTVSMEKIYENPMGVGTGNVDDHLTGRLKTYKSFDLASKKYNPHNQFLQTTLEIGLIGLVILLLFLGSTLMLARKKNNSLLKFILYTLIFNSLFESMLQRNSGIVFYSFWICLLVVYIRSQSDNKMRELGK